MDDTFEVHVHDLDTESPVDNPTATIRQPPLIPGLDGESVAKEEPLPDKRWSIFRVPACLREGDEAAYSPMIVSIGPLHFNAPHLKAMEAQKLRFLSRTLERISRQNTTLGSLEEAMKKSEEETRECYSEGFEDIKSDEFVRMMVVDGIFIVELLRLSGSFYKKELADDPIFATRSMPLNIGRDLLLLENQLPLFVLQTLFKLTAASSEEELSLEKLALQFFEPFRIGKDMIAIDQSDERRKYPHLLGLFHSSFAPTDPPPKPTQKGNNNLHPPHTQKEIQNTYRTFAGKGWVHGAKSLSHAGVIFRTKSGNVLDMKFKNKVMEIPTIFIDDSTTPVLRNLLTYEQYNRCAAPYFSSLAVFLNNIVDSEDDFNVLKESGILRVQYGAEELVKLFNSLTKELVFDMDYCYFGKMIQDIRGYSQTMPAKFMRVARTILPMYGKLLPIVMNFTLIYLTTIVTLSYNNSSSSAAPAPAPAPSA